MMNFLTIVTCVNMAMKVFDLGRRVVVDVERLRMGRMGWCGKSVRSARRNNNKKYDRLG